MRYGVVVCPHCGNAKGVERAAETTTCTRCRKGLTVASLKVFAETDSAGSLPVLVGRVQAQVTNAPPEAFPASPSNEPPDYDPLLHDSPMQFAAGVARQIVSVEARVESVARALGAALGSFSERELFEALREAGVEEGRLHDERVRLLVRSVLYEPRPGLYGLLG